MHPIHDVDVILLLATTLSAKRRPAELVEIMAATDLLTQGAIPAGAKMSEAFARLGVSGLIRDVDGSLTLTPAAEEIMAALPKRRDTELHLLRIKEQLAGYQPKPGCPPIEVTLEQLTTAITQLRASASSSVKNLLVPKPKPTEEVKRPGQRQRKPMPSGVRKAAGSRPRKA
jgi:hypothetical protein